MTEDEMAGWHHWLDGRECQWTLGVDDEHGGLACYDSWGHKELDTTELLICSDLSTGNTSKTKVRTFLLITNIGCSLYIIMWSYHKVLYIVSSHYLFDGSNNAYWVNECILWKIIQRSFFLDMIIFLITFQVSKKNKMNWIYFILLVGYLYQN